MALIGRRPLLLGLGLSPLAALAEEPTVDGIRFLVFRNGSEIGSHVLRFERDGERTVVTIEIELVVRLAFIPLYRYRHRNREVWDGDRLVAIDTETDDDGVRHRVRGEADGRDLVVEGDEGRLRLPGDILPTSYWRKEMVERRQWLDTQHGRVAEGEVEALGSETIEAGGSEVSAERFAIRGDLELDVWYADGVWSRLSFAGPDGSTIAYALREPRLAG
jgi:hypothetical protein